MGDPFELSKIDWDNKLTFSTLPKDVLKLLRDGSPPKRIEKVREIMALNLGKPFVAATRTGIEREHDETSPENMASEKTLRNANFMMESAGERGLVDRHLLASMLEVVTNSRSVDKMIAFYEKEFTKKALVSCLCFLM